MPHIDFGRRCRVYVEYTKGEISHEMFRNVFKVTWEGGLLVVAAAPGEIVLIDRYPREGIDHYSSSFGIVRRSDVKTHSVHPS